MTKTRYWQRVAACGLAAMALDATAQQQAAPKWGAHVDVEAKPGYKRSLGEADLFLPLTQSERSLVFASLRGRFDDHDNHEGNLGAGMRRMLDSGWNLGGYAYVDRRRSETGNRFSQATLGAEALGRDWDFRGNIYQPFGDRVKNTGALSSTASITGTTVQVVTRPFEERALEGYDLEAGWRVPLWVAEADTQLRIYAGGFRFSDSVAKISGPRVRAELAMYNLQSLWQGAQLMLGAEYQDDNVRGSQGFVSLRLRIPFGGGKTPGRRLNWQEQRMAAPVVRDVDVVTHTVVSATQLAAVETVTATASGQALTIIDSGTTTGAALPGAVAAAGTNSLVVLTGSYSTTATTNLQDGQTLMGAGTLTLRTPSGYTAVLTTPGATINGTVNTIGAINTANNSTITGLTINNSAVAGLGSSAVRVNGVTGVTISNSTISASEGGNNSANGILISTGGSATISNNTISAFSNGPSAGAAAAINVFNGMATIAGNTLSATGNYVDPTRHRFLSLSSGVTINSAASTGNTTAAGVCLNGGAIGTVSFSNGTTCP